MFFSLKTHLLSILEHLHQYVTTMVCVAVRGLPVIGVIHKPFDASGSDKQGRTFWSWLPFAISRDLNNYIENLPNVRTVHVFPKATALKA
jgi:inositol monophosphatase 3